MLEPHRRSPSRFGTLLPAITALSLVGVAFAGGPRWIDVNNSEEPARFITGMLEWDPDGIGGPEGTVLVVGTDQATNAGGFQNAADKAWAFRFNGVDWAPLGRDSTFTFPAPARDFADHYGVLCAAAGSVLRYDGTTWSVIGTPSAGGSVTELVSLNGDLYAAGTFTSIDGVAADNIAKWHAGEWSAVEGGLTGASGAAGGIVQDLEVFHDQLIAAGTFTAAGGAAASGLAVWDGAAWSAYPGAITSANPLVVNTLSAAPDGGVLYVGGNFNAVGGVPAGFCVARDANGWVMLPALTAMPDSIKAMTGGVYVGGNTFSGDGLPGWGGLRRLGTFAWQPVVTTALGAFGSGAAGLAEYRGAPIVARRTSPFTPSTGVAASVFDDRMTRLGVGTIGLHTSFLDDPSGCVFFDSNAANWTRNGLSISISIWNGTEFEPWLPELKARSVTSVLRQGDTMFVAGDFAPGNAAGARRIALRSQGVWTSLEDGIPMTPESDSDYLVTCIAPHEGKIHIGVLRFDTLQGFSLMTPSLWSLTGSVWSPVSDNIRFGGLTFSFGSQPPPFQVIAGFTLGLRHLVSRNGSLAVSGNYVLSFLNGVSFSTSNAVGDPLMLSMGLWSRLGPTTGQLGLGGTGPLNAGGIWEMKHVGSTLFASGAAYNSTGNQVYSGLMRLTPLGWDAPDLRSNAPTSQGFFGGTPASNSLPVPRSLVEYNGLLFTAGSFTGSLNPLPDSPQLAPGMSSIAAYNGEGWINLTWRNPATGQLSQGLSTSNGTTPADAYAMTLYDNKLLILGNFARAGGLSSPNIAVFDPGDAPVFTSTAPVTIHACPSASLQISAPAVTFAEADQWRHYQWFKDGLPMIEGAATPSGFGTYTGTQTPILVISNPQPSDSQSVVCKVTTIGGVAYSPSITPRILPDVSASPNGVVDTPDLVFFLGRFGEAAPAGSQAARVDFNRDGVVNTPDLATFLGRFGSACPN